MHNAKHELLFKEKKRTYAIRKLALPFFPVFQVHGAFVESWAEGIHQVFDNEECKALQELWNDPTVQQVYTRHSEYNLNDSTT